MQVTTTEGILEGETVSNEISGTYHSFKGIPYAAPPIGDLRFKAPAPPKPWEGVRSAKEHGSKCRQYNFISRLIEKGCEDCLFLNVYTPNLKPPQPLPVMIWIHGGGFICGSGNDDVYGPDFFVRQGVILVTFNYRIGVLGFLCLHTEDAPGNAGIKDQVAAMRWVNKNIANFGGDADNVTIIGQSSGACCVTFHCISPTTKGLFKRAIAQSGSMTTWPAQCFRPRDRAVALARKLGCHSDDNKEIYEYLIKQPIENLTDIQLQLTFAEKCCDKYETQFSIVSEQVFPNVETYWTGSLSDTLKNDIHEGVELIIGYNQDEGVVNLSVIYDINKTIHQANNFKEYFVPRELALFCTVNDQLDIGEAMRDFYLQKKPVVISNLEPLMKYYATNLYKFGIIQFAKHFAVKNKVYVYKFNCTSERNFFSKIMGAIEYFGDRQLVGHSDELPYLFPVKTINQKISTTSPTFRLIQNITKLWTNFAKTGNPTPDAKLGINWKPYRLEVPSYLEIGNTLVRSSGPDKVEINFWEQLYLKYYPSIVYQKPEEAQS